jgi:hypothetical protein
MSEIIKKFDVLDDIKKEFLNEIIFLYVFKDEVNKSNAFISTKSDKLFVIGSNLNGI